LPSPPKRPCPPLFQHIPGRRSQASALRFASTIINGESPDSCIFKASRKISWDEQRREPSEGSSNMIIWWVRSGPRRDRAHLLLTFGHCARQAVFAAPEDAEKARRVHPIPSFRPVLLGPTFQRSEFQFSATVISGKRLSGLRHVRNPVARQSYRGPPCPVAGPQNQILRCSPHHARYGPHYGCSFRPRLRPPARRIRSRPHVKETSQSTWTSPSRHSTCSNPQHFYSFPR